MGKKRRLNRFISKWIKSDLPKERSAVLLLGVTRIPTSPVPARRPCSLPLDTTAPDSRSQRRLNSLSNSRRDLVRRNSSRRRQATASAAASPQSCPDSETTPTPTPTTNTTISVRSHDGTLSSAVLMDRSVDSIGTCSLDVEASADLSDWSEVSSVGTLRSASITPLVEPHLPSYLSLACTVNGYSTTTNYDPDRLARSRDASPHRLGVDHLTNKHLATYSIQNNLLSPPNLVPLPQVSQIGKPMEHTLTQRHHQEFYSSQKSYRETRYYASDTIDACLENGHATYQSKCVSFETKKITQNGQTKTATETVRQEISNGKEIKSFIQQRVERLYGPGALAQGFFVSKRQKNRLSESDGDSLAPKPAPKADKHSKSMQDKLLTDEDTEPAMKQSTSSPTLPVMRHLRPEFRAQLPIISPRKEMPKSITVPKLKDDAPVNGHSAIEDKIPVAVLKDSTNTADAPKEPAKKIEVKDGHYFLNILDEQNKRLLDLADKTEKELENANLTEEIIGKIRSASGKARLLVSQKMQQFKGLCSNNINQSAGEAFPTTNEDLQGFWDMVMLQVNQVDALFAELDVIKQNGWKEVKPVKAPLNGTKARKVVAARPRPTANPVNEEARKQREAERKKMLEERRRLMKAQQQQKQSQNIEIFVPESS